MFTLLSKRLFGNWRRGVSSATPQSHEPSTPFENELSYSALVEALPEIVWTSRPNGEIDFANSRWYDFTGLTPEQTMGSGWTVAVHPDDLEVTLKTWMRALETGEPVEVMYRVRHVSGQFRWLLGRGVPIRQGNQIVKWFGSLTDIEERKQVEELLREDDRRKDEFLATLTHELRNPLAPIRNMLEVIRQQGDTGESVNQAVAVMDRQLKQMVRLIDDLLDVTHIRKGRFTLRLERVELSAVIAQALEASRPLIETARHQLKVSLPDEPIFLEADPARLAQVFGNVLNNASKYTPSQGKLQLSVERVADLVVVRVKDNGSGVAPEMRERVFEMFTQGTSHSHESPGGLGIGLTLARRFVELHQGRIEVRSDGVNCGTEVVIALPVSKTVPQLPTFSQPARPSSTAQSVLVIDDNRDAAESFATFLRGLGHEVGVAFDGQSGVELADATRPRIIFCDLAMPGMNGTEVAARIRRQIPRIDAMLIALTGYGTETDRQKSVAAGFDYHLVKPIDLQELDDILANVDAGSTAALV